MASPSSLSSSSSSILFLIAFLPLLSLSTSLSFSFPVFNSSVSQYIKFQNDTFFDRVIKLTKNEIGSDISHSVGRAYYGEAFHLHDASTATFMATALPSSSLLFPPSSLPTLLKPLGLVDRHNALNASANQFVAVEFDTFMNSWDPSADHVGININSMRSAAVITWNSSIKDGRKANAWITYNATMKNLSVFLTYDPNPTYSGNSSLDYTVDLREFLPEKVAVGFSAATGSLTEIHNIVTWDFSSTPLNRRKKISIGIFVGVILAVGFLSLGAGMYWFFVWKKKSKSKSNGEEELECDEEIDGEFENGRGPKRFPFAMLASATRNFSDERKLGEGGFGCVYKGILCKPKKLEVAIKRVSKASKQGKKEYVSEVRIISRLRHRNLVQLVGWCHENKELLLVYEFMANGSLDTHLHGRDDDKQTLRWPMRYKVAIGLASALLYLHEEWEECVVHRDIKPSNVMLDAGFNAKLGDFGLARLACHEQGLQTTILAGTMGYLAPEIVLSGKASKESDVYSFGIVLLEVACGRRPVESNEPAKKVVLVPWVWKLYGSGDLLSAADERLNSEFVEGEMISVLTVGLWCAHPEASLRPTIRQALAVLNLEAPLPQLPSKMPVPMYYAPPPTEFSTFTYTSSTTGVDSVFSGYNTTRPNAAMKTTTLSSSSANFLKQDKFDL
ncbi:hypothetical protein HPP92_017570 [Vanilla planifolia]|uniref:non-specific serine/threonine protein kinase n=1 Tax=Vanilla planifolia TaxID=51239 RepID=A0A835QD01_VANPL|nr:hypothetical protein HPP92_017570 [Vanilla planifolia]